LGLRGYEWPTRIKDVEEGLYATTSWQTGGRATNYLLQENPTFRAYGSHWWISAPPPPSSPSKFSLATPILCHLSLLLYNQPLW
jgi:hypothetical protein